MSIWELQDDAIKPVDTTAFATEGVLEQGHLQKVLAKNIAAIDPQLLVIAAEYSAWQDSRRRIDILALDQNANLVVIELEPTEDGGHMDLRAIRYAAMVSTMTFAKAVEAFEAYLRKQGSDDDAEAKILEFLEWGKADEENFANDVAIVLASAEFSREITATVLWLSTKYNIDIRCVRLRPYNLDGRLLLDIQQIVPLKRTARQSSRDYTRFDLTVAGRTYSALPKNRLMLTIARAVVETGADPAEVAELLPSAARRWVSVEGQCSGEEFLQKLADERTARGKPVDTRRYFTKDDDLIPFKGRTYAFSTQWGTKTLEAANKVASAYKDLAIEIQVTEAGTQWDEPSFFAVLEEDNGPEVTATARRIYEWSQQHMPSIWWGKGSQYGGFIPGIDHNGTWHQLIEVWTNGDVEIQFQHMKKSPPFDQVGSREELRRQLNKLPSMSLEEDAIDGRPRVKLSVFAQEDVLGQFLSTLEWAVGEILAR